MEQTKEEKRADILKTRRSERLQNELLGVYGAQRQDQIRKAVSRNVQIAGMQNYKQLYDQTVQDLNTQREVSPMASPTPPPDTKRQLPIKPKERIYDEWGAVMRQMDEVDREAQQQEKRQMKMRQQEYKHFLDQQKLSQERERRLKQENNLNEDKQLIKSQIEQNADQINSEKNKMSQMYKRAGEMAEESMLVRNKIELEKRMQQELEKETFRQYYQEMREREKQESEARKKQKIKDQSELKNDLTQQEQFKRRMEKLEKEKDRSFAMMEKIESDKHEHQRQKFFDKLNSYQKVNEQREQLYGKFQQENLEEKALRDEQMYVNKIKQSERLEAEQKMRELEEKRGYLQDNAMALDQQIKEKGEQKGIIKQEENYYAKIIEDRLNQEKKEDMRLQQKAKENREIYRQSLEGQMQEQLKRKKYEGLMTEHERKVNNLQIEAYQAGNTRVSARIAGFRGHRQFDPMERYMKSRVYKTPTPYRNAISPNISMLKKDDSITETRRSLDRSQDVSIFPPISNPSPVSKPNFHYTEHNAVLPKAGPNYQRINEIAEETRRNMHAPGVQQFRHITSNKGYGVSRDQEVQQSLNYLSKSRFHHNLSTSRNTLKNSISLREVQLPSRIASRDLTPSRNYQNTLKNQKSFVLEPPSFLQERRSVNLHTSPMNLLEKQQAEKIQNFNRNNVLIYETEQNSKGVFGLLPGTSRNLIPKEGRNSFGRKQTEFFQKRVHKDYNIIRGF